MSRAAPDASAVLASLHGKRGAKTVTEYLGGSLALTVNIAEASARRSDSGLTLRDELRPLDFMGIESIASEAEAILASAAIRGVMRTRRLSSEDCACLQLAARRSLAALAVDLTWAELDMDLEESLICD